MTAPSVEQQRAEVTKLSPAEERRFQAWIRANAITDADQPGSFYDYRGYWKEFGDKPITFGVDHFTDTYKQHGHPTFSVESKYSKGKNDGGHWEGETFVPQAFVGPSQAAPTKRTPAHLPLHPRNGSVTRRTPHRRSPGPAEQSTAPGAEGRSYGFGEPADIRPLKPQEITPGPGGKTGGMELYDEESPIMSFVSQLLGASRKKGKGY